MAKTHYLENAIINFWLRANAGSFTSPATVYVGLMTADTDTEDQTFTEVAGGSYARTAVTFGAASLGVSSNTAKVTFPKATADNGTVTHYGIFDASSGGNALYIEAFSSPWSYATDVQPEFDVGDLTVSED